jgi:hypothetical protein
MDLLGGRGSDRWSGADGVFVVDLIDAHRHRA